MTMMRSVLAAVAFGATALSATAQEPSLPDISGAWQGTGEVQRNENASPVGVRCAIDGRWDVTSVGFDGECRAMLIMKRAIGAELQRQGERYTGVYIGSNAGPAQLDGTLTAPNTLTLNMTFENEVNGDDQAVMTIERTGDDEFRIETRDTMESGVEVTTANITFLRQ